MYATLPSFTHFGPRSTEHALDLLAEHATRARILAGGCDLMPELRRRRSSPSVVVGLAGVAGINGIALDEEGLRIGAMASLRRVERHPGLRSRYAALYEGIHSLASVQVKATGTLVGNLCVATPASDIAPPLMVLGARVRVVRAGGERSFPVSELFAGPKRHTLAPSELVIEALVPAPPSDSGSAFAKLTRTAADIAKLNAAAFLRVQDGTITQVRIALGALAPTTVRVEAAEALLLGQRPTPELFDRAAATASADLRPITDLRSTAAYRKTVAAVLVRRVLDLALTRALGGVA